MNKWFQDDPNLSNYDKFLIRHESEKKVKVVYEDRNKRYHKTKNDLQRYAHNRQVKKDKYLEQLVKEMIEDAEFAYK